MAIITEQLNNEWQVLQFRDCIIQLNTGLNPRTNFSLGTGSLKYITAKNLTDHGTIDFSNCDAIDEAAKEIINRRSDIQIGDILFSSRAPIGHCHLIKEEPDFYDIGESIFSIRPKSNIVLPEYFCLYLTSDLFVKSATLNVTGSIIQEIRIGDLMNTDIIVPSLKEQHIIAKCFSLIDRKIELNNLINDNLQQQLKLLYDYWFTQFDFPDNNGHPYRSSGGNMKWHDLLKREIPNSWNVQQLGELVSLKNGINYDKSVQGDCSYRIVNVRDISASDLIINEKNCDEICLPKSQGDKYLLTENDIIIARSGTPGATRLLIHPSEHVIFCGFIICCTPLQSVHHNYLCCYLKQLEGSSATKTGGSILQNVSQDTLNRLLVVIPPNSVLEMFNRSVNTMIELINKKTNENRQLIILRDWLLPMLINGQATIAD